MRTATIVACSSILSLAAAPQVLGFAAPQPLGRALPPLRSMAITDREDESAYRYMMARARDAAFQGTANAAEAKQYLQEILHLQEGCISGSLTSKDLCENVQETAEIVARLRQQVETKGSAIEVGPVISTAASLVPLATVITMALIYAFSVHSTTADVIPFTAQEWVWAARDGYLDTMVSHFMHSGGLPAVEGETMGAVAPFTPQEWIWAIQGGYLPNMLTELYQSGGLRVDEEGLASVATPFTREEWMWAIQGGYFPTMLSHFIRNGGL